MKKLGTILLWCLPFGLIAWLVYLAFRWVQNAAVNTASSLNPLTQVTKLANGAYNYAADGVAWAGATLQGTVPVVNAVDANGKVVAPESGGIYDGAGNPLN